MPETIKVATVAEVPSGERKSIIVDELPALLLRAGDDFYCIEDVCTHDGQPLTDGPFEDCAITCPRHGAKFDVKTGAPLCMPATEPIRVYPVEVRGEDVYVTVE